MSLTVVTMTMLRDSAFSNMDGGEGFEPAYGTAETAPGRARDLRRLGSFDNAVLNHPNETIAEKIGTALQTVREWRRLGRVPANMLRAVRALVLGDLGVIDPGWKDWRLENGKLVSPDGGDYVFTRAEVMALPFMRRKLAEAERQLDALRTPPPPPEPLTLQADIFGQWTKNPYVGPEVAEKLRAAEFQHDAQQQRRELRYLRVSRALSSG